MLLHHEEHGTCDHVPYPDGGVGGCGGDACARGVERGGIENG